MTNPFKYDMVPYTRGIGIEINDQNNKTFPHFIKWHSDALSLLKGQSMDFVVYISKKPYREDLTIIIKLIKIKGYLNLICRKENSILKLMEQYSGWQVQEVYSHEDYVYYALMKTGQKHQLSQLPQIKDKKCAVVRYGGIGDMMMASIIFPELKKQGYHITLYTHVNSWKVLKYNPYIDKVVLQDSGQVPAEDYRDFIFHTKKKYDKFIHLSESIEGSLLSLPDRVTYYWPTAIRHKLMNHNYYEFTSEIAEVPLNTTQNFYRTPQEETESKKYIKKFKSRPIIMWVLSGSSVHKFWPYQDQVIARILLQYPSAHIIFVGDEASKLLEQGWENEDRVHCTSGILSVREVMSLCYEVDLIVTPETGVFLAVQFNDVPKILLLSHSSPSNYAISLKNCVTVTSDNCKCYPCHQMHYGFEFCSTIEMEDENGDSAMIAECQVKLDPENVAFVINKILNKEYSWQRQVA